MKRAVSLDNIRLKQKSIAPVAQTNNTVSIESEKETKYEAETFVADNTGTNG
jgi:hypothetical protein